MWWGRGTLWLQRGAGAEAGGFGNGADGGVVVDDDGVRDGRAEVADGAQEDVGRRLGLVVVDFVEEADDARALGSGSGMDFRRGGDHRELESGLLERAEFVRDAGEELERVAVVFAKKLDELVGDRLRGLRDAALVVEVVAGVNE